MSEIKGEKGSGRMLDEFEVGSVNSLAPFEDESAILLEDFPGSGSGGDLLDEFDAAIEKIYIDEILGSMTDDEEAEEVEEEEPGNEEGEDEDVTGEGEDETLELGAEEEYIEKVEPPEPEAEPVVPEGPFKPVNPVIGFICESALDTAKMVDPSGKMYEIPNVRVMPVPCAGMVKPSWLKMALDKGASGVFVVSCTEGSCRHRRGVTVLNERWSGDRRPMVLSSCDIRRLRRFTVHPVEGGKVIGEIMDYLSELGRLDALEEGPKPRPVEKPEAIHWPDF